LHLAGLYRWLDVHYAHEQGADVLGKWVFAEDWAMLNAEHPAWDYRWMQATAGDVLIAHALGGAGTDQANTLPQLRRSYTQGLRIMEIDIWLGVDGILYCHHGPEQPIPHANACTFKAALREAVAQDLWLVLDIKTAFETTARRIVQQLQQPNDATHLVFQLYQPADYQLFVQLQQTLPLAGPILTGYVSRRSGNHLLQQAQRLGIAAVALPLHRLPALYRPLPNKVMLLTHPVHDCAAYLQARAFGARGMYVAGELINRQQGQVRCLSAH